MKYNIFSADKVLESILPMIIIFGRSEEHTSELQSLTNLVCRLLLEKKKQHKKQQKQETKKKQAQTSNKKQTI